MSTQTSSDSIVKDGVHYHQFDVVIVGAGGAGMRAAIEAGPGAKTAAMGGSFGGYMANWVAGHTDRFRAIVTHASLWALDQFAGTTDASSYWQEIFTPEAMALNSPHRYVEDISTPLLVIHGDRDYRVPIGEIRSRALVFGCTNDTPSRTTWCRVKAGRALGWARRRYLAPE